MPSRRYVDGTETFGFCLEMKRTPSLDLRRLGAIELAPSFLQLALLVTIRAQSQRSTSRRLPICSSSFASRTRANFMVDCHAGGLPSGFRHWCVLQRSAPWVLGVEHKRCAQSQPRATARVSTTTEGGGSTCACTSSRGQSSPRGAGPEVVGRRGSCVPGQPDPVPLPFRGAPPVARQTTDDFHLRIFRSCRYLSSTTCSRCVCTGTRLGTYAEHAPRISPAGLPLARSGRASGTTSSSRLGGRGFATHEPEHHRRSVSDTVDRPCVPATGRVHRLAAQDVLPRAGQVGKVAHVSPTCAKPHKQVPHLFPLSSELRTSSYSGEKTVVISQAMEKTRRDPRC